MRFSYKRVKENVDQRQLREQSDGDNIFPKLLGM